MPDGREHFLTNPYPSTGAAVGGVDITKIMVCGDSDRAKQIREQLINGILLNANRGRATPSENRVFCIYANVGKGKTHLFQHIIRKAAGEDVITAGIDIPSLNNLYTVYTVPHPAAALGADRQDLFYSWLYNRIVNLEDDSHLGMGFVNTPSLPAAKRKGMTQYINDIYRSETQRDTVRALSALSPEQFFRLLSKTSKRALEESGKKGILLVIDEMEGPLENLAGSPEKYQLLVDAFRGLVDSITGSDLPLFLVFCFTIQPFNRLEQNQGITTVAAFVSRLRTNMMLLQVEFTDTEIAEFLKYSLRTAVRDRREFEGYLRSEKLWDIYPFPPETPQIMRRYLRGDPRYVCQESCILFGDWLDSQQDLTLEYVINHFERKRQVNKDQLRSLRDRLQDLAYIVRILHNSTHMIEISKATLIELLAEKASDYGVAGREQVENDLDLLTAKYPDVMSYDADREVYVAGQEFLEIYGYVPQLPPEQPSPEVLIKGQLNVQREILAKSKDKELGLILFGLQSLLRQRGFDPVLDSEAILVRVEGFLHLLYPTIKQVSESHARSAIELMQKRQADTIVFVGNIPTRNMISTKAKALLDRTPHPRSEELVGQTATLKDICRDIGSQADLVALETQFPTPTVARVTDVRNIYTGMKQIGTLRAESELWIMALPHFLDNVPDESQQTAITNHIEARILPILSNFIQLSSTAEKAKALSRMGDFGTYLPTSTNARQARNLKRAFKKDGLLKGVPIAEIRKEGLESAARSLETYGLWNTSFNAVASETDIRSKNLVAWLVLEYIRKQRPKMTELYTAFGADGRTKSRLRAYVEILITFVLISEDSKTKQLLPSKEKPVEALKSLVVQFTSITSNLQDAGHDIDDEFPEGFIDDVNGAEELIRLRDTGKAVPEGEFRRLIPILNSEVQGLEAMFSQIREQAESFVRSLKVEHPAKSYRDFAKFYSQITESDLDAKLTEAEVRHYLGSLNELDPPITHIADAVYNKFQKTRNEISERLRDGKYGLILKQEDSYRAARQNLESTISRAKSQLFTNLDGFNNRTISLQRKVTRFCLSLGLNLSFEPVEREVTREAIKNLRFSRTLENVVSGRRAFTTNLARLAEWLRNTFAELTEKTKESRQQIEKSLRSVVSALKKEDMYRTEPVEKARKRLDSLFGQLDPQASSDELQRIEKEIASLEKPEDSLSKLHSFHSRYISPASGAAPYERLSYFGTILKNAKGMVDAIPSDVLTGSLKAIYLDVKGATKMRRQDYNRLEKKHGAEFWDSVGKLCKFGLLELG